MEDLGGRNIRKCRILPPTLRLRSSVFIILLFGLASLPEICQGARLKRAVMMDMGSDIPQCLSGTVTERNSSTSVILTGTVKKCDKTGSQKYSCRVQIWRIMKGKTFTSDLVEVTEEPLMTTMYTKAFVEIYGLGNRGFCDSEVKEDKTRIFFLNRVDDRLVLAASLLHITLTNLENTEKVIRGEKIVEAPKKPKDPCLFVLCGFGAVCETSDNGTATCVCPKITCGGSPDSSDTYAPVCGTDGVTYPSECRLKASQCWSQRRIRIASKRPCSPLQETNPCDSIVCGNHAKCVVQNGVGKCQCVSCDDVMTSPVCGSDQVTYRSECDLRRDACLNARSIQVVRRQPCDPCFVFNETSKMFVKKCSGRCAWDQDGNSRCCNDIPCESNDDMMICGSNGRTYKSECALLRDACKSGKNITKVAVGSCPSGRETTVIRGSTSIANDDKCPGNCDESSPEFITFKKAFEANVNERLDVEYAADIDNRMLSDFKVDEVRKGSAVIVYSAMMFWPDKPIGEDFTPGEDALWAFERLHDPAKGVLKYVINSMEVTPISNENPAVDFVIEEVCGDEQCRHGASCKLSKDESGRFLHNCDCSVIGNPKLLPVTLGCQLANNNRFYDNKIAVNQASCVTHSFLTFRDVCRDKPPSLCDDIECELEGSACILTNNVPSCECITCNEDFDPVCGSNDRTYRNLCALQRENCMSGTMVTVKSKGMCASACDEVDCRHGGQCEELSQGNALCICPSSCIEAYASICGSDGVTYQNDCLMTIASCVKRMEITVVNRGDCRNDTDVGATIKPEPTEPESSGEGSGEGDGCNCKFGATCEATIDDEDGTCVCDIKCEGLGSTVCGSDGATYFSECELLKVQCEKQEAIEVVSQGRCPDHCSKSAFGCCADGINRAEGSRRAGCPEICQCDVHGSYSKFCNHTTGQCLCRPGVGGLRCDQCQPGYWNFRAIAEKRSVGCMNCWCEKGGSVRDDCDQMTGQCMCKEGVSGVKCSKCESGEWVTPEGCVEGSNVDTASSCEGLTCEFGQECVELVDQQGRYQCQCPPLSSCDSVSGGKVCASNGVTYANECHMRVISCRESKLVQTLAKGTCEDYFRALEVLHEKLTTTSTTTQEITKTVFPVVSTTVSSTTTESSTSFTTSAMKPAPTEFTSQASSTELLLGGDLEPEESGDGMTIPSSNGGTDDDEDYDLDIDISGDDDPESALTYRAKAHIISASGTDLEFSDDLLAKESELYAEYSDIITSKFTTILSKMKNHGGVIPTSIREFSMEPAEGRGVMATFSLSISALSSLPDIENFINDYLLLEETFAFLDDPAVHRVVPPLRNVSHYFEDGIWNTPQFGGSSFMEFKKMEAESAATIHMTFKSSDREGLLLYNGLEKGVDFISLAIIGGYVEFRFDTGSGQLSLRSTIRVDDGNWHVVVSRRNRREGMLKVDNEQEVVGTSPSRTTSVNLDTNLFIGWVPDSLRNKVFKDTNVMKGLTGCIKDVKVGQHGQQNLPLTSDNKKAVNTYRVAECSPSPCMPNPCMHSSKCFITYQLEDFTYKCECGYQYYGDKCQHLIMRDSCSSSPCHESSTCVKDDNSYRCICPPSRKGKNCESLNEDLQPPMTVDPSYMPMFAGDSYIERPSLTGVSTTLDIEIVFFTYQLEGLIFYNAQSNTGEGDFIALNLRNGHLEFMYDLGQGPALMKSLSKVSLNKWHVAKLSRVMRVGDLMLDDDPIVKGETPNLHTQLNLGEHLYIGSVPNTVTLPPNTGITTGLMGAIQKFVVNDVMLPQSLVDEDSTQYHVQAFNGHACFRKPCQNEGVCLPDLGNFSCDCKAGFSGMMCTEVEETDEEEATMLQDPFLHAAFFDGNAKAQYYNYITRKGTSFKSNRFEFQLRTTATQGLIFYNGKSTRRGDYMAVALNHGRLHLTYDLGTGPTNLVSDILVNDGTWKTVKIVRKEHRASLQVDDRPAKQTASPPLTKWLNTDGVLWMGGCDAEYMPHRNRQLPKSFYIGFKGCLRRFHIDGNLLRLREDALNLPGLATCPQNR